MIRLSILKNEAGDNTFIGTGEAGDFKCSICNKDLVTGFMCENKQELVLCEDCQDSFRMNNCKHNKFNEHKHIKFTKSK